MHMSYCYHYLKDLELGLRTSLLLNNSITRFLDISSNEAIKKKFVYDKASKPRYGSMGYDEVHLTYNNPVLYLLKSGKLEGGRQCSTDCIYLSQIYYIKESL